jgi:glycosyltransferase involved in cell wall biosynthesis
VSKTVFVTFVYPGSEIHLPRMFSSLREQTDNDFDIVIFNDGVQNIEEIYGKFLTKAPHIRLVKGSIPKVRTLGLLQLKNLGYDNVIFGDADDSFAPNRVEVSKNLLRVHDLVVNEIDVHNVSSGKILYGYFQKSIPSNARFDFEAIRNCNFIGFTNSSVRASKIPQIDFPDQITAVDWALFSTLMLEGADAYFTGDTTTAYFVHEKSHYDIFSDDLASNSYKAGVKLQHYKYLCSVGFSFERERKQYEALLNDLIDIPFDDFYNQKSFLKREQPLWWDLQTRICKGNVIDV